MSRGWNPRREGLPSPEFRKMVWIGLILGLLAFQVTRRPPQPMPDKPPAATVAPPDPYSASRRSQANLETQERAPAEIGFEADGSAPARVAASAVRVIDGDTFDHGGVRIRIADIDTPEARGDCAYEIGLAARATARMRALLAAGAFELRPNPDGRDEDLYGRKLRIVTRGGRSLGAVLVAEGLARPWTGRREPWC